MRPIGYNANSASALVRGVLDMLVSDGEKGVCWETVAPRGIPTREIRNACYQLVDPTRCATWLPERKLNYQFMAAEFLWIFCGRDDVEMIGYYNENIKQFSDDGQIFFGAYGPRWREQIQYVYATLVKDPTSRQAIVSYWRPVITEAPYLVTRDVPCTLSTQYLIRNAQLEAITTMRSSDAWLGLPYDLYNQAMLQRALAAELDVPVGSLTFHVGSSHLYERDLEKARAVLEGPLYSEAENLVIPGPPGLEYRGVMEDEMWIRAAYKAAPGDLEPETIDQWQELLSCLAYRRHRDLERLGYPYYQLMGGKAP
jgi:thymidylate synthase